MASLRFRHPLRLFQRYRLRTRIVSWDDDTFYLRQTFERGGRTLASGYICATFLGAHGPVHPVEVLAEVGQVAQRPPKPAVVSQLQALAASIHQEQKEHAVIAVHAHEDHA